jgi:glycosyltransferase involved in cell wall biosynthesis
LNETNAGVDAKSVEDIKDALRKSYVEYKLRDKINYQGIAEKVNKYSYREIAKQLAEVISAF